MTLRIAFIDLVSPITAETLSFEIPTMLAIPGIEFLLGGDVASACAGSDDGAAGIL